MEEKGRNIAVAFVFDEHARRQKNAQKCNFWFAYIEEIFNHLGIQAQRLTPEALEDENIFTRFTALIIGESVINERAVQNLQAWVEQGGILIGFRCETLHDLFGNKSISLMKQPESDFTPAAYLSLTDDSLTEGIHSPWYLEQELIIFSDVLLVEPEESEPIARLRNIFGQDINKPAITKRQVGKGWAFYFAFDLPKTVWVLQQGRPVDADYAGDGWLRTGDAIVIGKNNPELLYSYELLLLLQNMLALQPYPLVYPLPPTEGKITDVLFFYGGDDECDETGVQLLASQFMRSRSLPYHINLMPQKDVAGEWQFAVTQEEFQEILANGHECSLHYNFISDNQHPHIITREEVQEQMNAYMQMFGQKPICTVNHCFLWSGWYELAAWMLEAGGKADNSRAHVPSPPANPVNRIGFSFGSSLPYRIYTDWREGNEPMDFLILPVVFYEVGYTANTTDFELLRQAVDIAAYYHLTANFFYHPVYIARNENCRQAIDELLRYVEERNLIARHMGCDEMVHWWQERLQVRVDKVIENNKGIRFEVKCPSHDGCIIKLPLGNRSLIKARCDSDDVVFAVRCEFGQRWLYMIIPPGKHAVEVEQE